MSCDVTNSLHPNCRGRTLLILFSRIILDCRGILSGTVTAIGWYPNPSCTIFISGLYTNFTCDTPHNPTPPQNKRFSRHLLLKHVIFQQTAKIVDILFWLFVIWVTIYPSSPLLALYPPPPPPLCLPLLVVALVWDCVWRLKLPVKERSARAGDSRVVQMLTLPVGESSGAKNSTLSEERGELEKAGEDHGGREIETSGLFLSHASVCCIPGVTSLWKPFCLSLNLLVYFYLWCTLVGV